MSEPEVTSVLGCTGSGKTTLLMALLKDVKRHIVMTTKPSGFRAGWIQVKTPKELLDVLLKNYSKPKLRICLRLVVGPKDMKTPVLAMNSVANILFQMQKMALKKGIIKDIGLTIDEAQVFCPHYGDQSGVSWLVGQGREWRICPTFSTQRPTNIPPVIRDNSKNMYVLMLGGDAAIDTVKKVLGKSFKHPRQFEYVLYREGIKTDEGDTKKPKKILKLP